MLTNPTDGATSKLRALVVEDEWHARNYLVELLESTGCAQVVGAVATSAEARSVLREEGGRAVDVAFLDVELAESDGAGGLAVARELASSPDAPMFVFATAHDRHALEAFRLGVVDYLLKPFTEERVEQCVRRLLARGRERPPSASPARIVARCGNALVFLERDEVWAFEASDRLTFVHTAHGTFDLELSLTSVEASFGSALQRVHRRWLVNTVHVRQLVREGSDTKIFVGAGIAPDGPGLWVPVARERSGTVRAALLAGAHGLRRP